MAMVVQWLVGSIVWDGIRKLTGRKIPLKLTCHQDSEHLIITALNRSDSRIVVYDVRLMFHRAYGYRPDQISRNPN
jgi:hypothetical protein